MSPQSPTQVTIFAYQVGFGDCFLLRFHYDGFDRHVLIDFGSYPKPKGVERKFMLGIAEGIRDRCNGKLDAVVVTHRHADHINGFATDKDGSGTVIADCHPDLIVQPWTEDPGIRLDAIAPTAAFAASDSIGQALQKDRAFVAALDNMHRLAAIIRTEAHSFAESNPELEEELGVYGEKNLPNLSAIDNLMEMGKEPHKSKYVFFGSGSGLENILPGVEVQVLGPCTIAQSDAIRHQVKTDPDEFWQLMAMAAERNNCSGELLFPNAKSTRAAEVPPHARWLVERLKSLRGRDLLEIVRSLDDVLNNTSVILLFKVGNKKLLFPGDAQIEDWSYAFSQPGVLEELKDVDFYKVGHHGSLNATPKTLWNGLIHATTNASDKERLVTILSTQPGVHGKEDKNTEVPRRTLVQQLKAKSKFYTTQGLTKTPGACREIPMEV